MNSKLRVRARSASTAPASENDSVLERARPEPQRVEADREERRVEVAPRDVRPVPRAGGEHERREADLRGERDDAGAGAGVRRRTVTRTRTRQIAIASTYESRVSAMSEFSGESRATVWIAAAVAMYPGPIRFSAIASARPSASTERSASRSRDWSNHVSSASAPAPVTGSSA